MYFNFSQENIMQMILKAILLLIFLSNAGCAMHNDLSFSLENDNLDLEYPYEIFPFRAALYIPDTFNSYTLSSTFTGNSSEQTLSYTLGKDFSRSLPIFLANRFNTLEFVTSYDHFDRYDYVFVPNVAFSTLKALTVNNSSKPSYSLSVKLKLAVYKKDTILDTIRANSSLVADYDVICTSCEGVQRFNKQKLANEYANEQQKVYASLDTYLLSIMNSDCM